jgi:hypothetical protein
MLIFEFMRRLAIAWASTSGDGQPASNGAALIPLLQGGGEGAPCSALKAMCTHNHLEIRR